MTDVARLGVGIELVGRRAELATLTGALERAAAGRPAGVLLAGDAGVGKSRLLAELVERAGRAGLPGAGRPLPGHGRVGAAVPAVHRDRRPAGRRPTPSWSSSTPRCATCCPATTPRAEPAVEDRRLGQVRVFDAVLSVLDELAASGADAGGGGGPALGRPVQPGPAGVPAVPALRPAAAAGGQLPHRRPAPAAPAAPGAGRAGPAAGRAAGGAGPARPGEHAGSWCAGWPPAGCPSRRCSGPPGAARATPSSPRSWSRPGPTGCRTSWPSCWSPGSTGWPRTDPAGAADRLGRRPPGPARPAGRGVRAGRPTCWSRRCGTRWPTTCWSPCPARPPTATPTRSGTRCCARRSTTSCCPASAAGSTPATPRCWPSLDRPPGSASRGGPPSWRTTRWPGTTCRWRWPPRCGRPARPTSGRRRPSCCCTPNARSSCGRRCRTRRRWPGSTRAP